MVPVRAGCGEMPAAFWRPGVPPYEWLGCLATRQGSAKGVPGSLGVSTSLQSWEHGKPVLGLFNLPLSLVGPAAGVMPGWSAAAISSRIIFRSSSVLRGESRSISPTVSASSYSSRNERGKTTERCCCLSRDITHVYGEQLRTRRAAVAPAS